MHRHIHRITGCRHCANPTPRHHVITITGPQVRPGEAGGVPRRVGGHGRGPREPHRLLLPHGPARPRGVGRGWVGGYGHAVVCLVRGGLLRPVLVFSVGSHHTSPSSHPQQHTATAICTAATSAVTSYLTSGLACVLPFLPLGLNALFSLRHPREVKVRSHAKALN